MGARRSDTEQLGRAAPLPGSDNSESAAARGRDVAGGRESVGAIAAAARARLANARSAPPPPVTRASAEALRAVTAIEARDALPADASDEARRALAAYTAGPRPPIQRGPQAANRAVPRIDRVEVRFGRQGTSEDRTSTRVVVLLDAAAVRDVALLRIMRSSPGPVRDLRVPDVLGAVALDRLAGHVTSRNGDIVSAYSRRLTSTSGALDVSSPVDPGTGLRVGRIPLQDRPGRPSDPSVTSDPKTIARLAIQSPATAVDLGAVVPRAGSAGSSEAALQPPDFRQIASFTPDSVRARRVGPWIELSYVDLGVSYGHSYSYFVSTVDRLMRESVRSQIVRVEVVDVLPPAGLIATITQPSWHEASLSFVPTSGSEFVEKVEVFRREAGAAPPDELETDVIAGPDGLSYSLATRTALPSDFVQVAEARCFPGLGGHLVDPTVIPGRTYEYRLYAVDCFGNKQQVPTELSLSTRDPRLPDAPPAPSVEAAVDQASGFISVRIGVDDARATSVFLSRRDRTTRQVRFTDPGTPSHSVFGQRSGRPVASLNAPSVGQSNELWNGFLRLEGTGSFRSATFVDKLSRRGRVYQYAAHCVDNRGCRSSEARSRTVEVTVEPRVDAPVGLRGTVAVSGSHATGVALSWSEANVQQSGFDLLGSQDALADTSVRTVYQVQRRSVDGRWEDFPLSSGTDFFDPLSSDPPPAFRPAYPVLGRSYQYRVASLQTGSAYSSFCEPVDVTVEPPAPAPAAVDVTTNGLRVRPLLSVLSWDDPEPGTLVDGWEVERAAVNFLFYRGLRVDLDQSALSFERLGFVTLESSRASSRSADGTFSGARLLGRRFLLQAVSPGNVYVYRVRLVTRAGKRSEWSYATLSAVDDTVETRIRAALTSRQLEQLAAQQVALDASEVER